MTDYVVVKLDDCNEAVDVMDEVIAILKTVECGQDVWDRVFAVRRWLENGGCTLDDLNRKIVELQSDCVDEAFEWLGVRLYGV
mgnify:CR=1 FL=1